MLGERAAYWERTRTLFVADPHFGKAAAFRAAGVPVPRGTTGETLSRLDAALDRTRAERIVFLGDFLHAREGRAPETLRVINDWRSRSARRSRCFSCEAITTSAPAIRRASSTMRCENAPVVETPFVFTHQPVRSDDGYVLCGHVHPGARLSGPADSSMRLPCFWFGREIAVLPAFGEFTGLATST